MGNIFGVIKRENFVVTSTYNILDIILNANNIERIDNNIKSSNTNLKIVSDEFNLIISKDIITLGENSSELINMMNRANIDDSDKLTNYVISSATRNKRQLIKKLQIQDTRLLIN